jgi:hypothetical protein
VADRHYRPQVDLALLIIHHFHAAASSDASTLQFCGFVPNRIVSLSRATLCVLKPNMNHSRFLFTSHHPHSESRSQPPAGPPIQLGRRRSHRDDPPVAHTALAATGSDPSAAIQDRTRRADTKAPQVRGPNALF